MSDLLCKNCGQPTSPLYVKKYNGLCLACSNAGVAELIDERDSLRARVKELVEALNSLRWSVKADLAIARASEAMKGT